MANQNNNNHDDDDDDDDDGFLFHFQINLCGVCLDTRSSWFCSSWDCVSSLEVLVFDLHEFLVLS